MSEYFLQLPGESRPRPYSEYEVLELLGQGIIDSKTLIWTKGMTDWMPADQVITLPQAREESSAPSVEEEEPSVPAYRLRYSLTGLSRISVGACIIFLPCMLWSMWVILSTNATTYTEIQQAMMAQVSYIPSALSPLVFVIALLFIPSLLIQLLWLFRASSNVRGFQLKGIRFSPWLSVILSCMPIGMVFNAIILQELYKASKNPEDWMRHPSSPALRLYLIITLALTLFALFPIAENQPLIAFLIQAALMTAAVAAWSISILQISKAQTELEQRNTSDKLPPTPDQ